MQKRSFGLKLCHHFANVTAAAMYLKQLKPSPNCYVADPFTSSRLHEVIERLRAINTFMYMIQCGAVSAGNIRTGEEPTTWSLERTFRMPKSLEDSSFLQFVANEITKLVQELLHRLIWIILHWGPEVKQPDFNPWHTLHADKENALDGTADLYSLNRRARLASRFRTERGEPFEPSTVIELVGRSRGPGGTEEIYAPRSRLSYIARAYRPQTNVQKAAGSVASSPSPTANTSLPRPRPTTSTPRPTTTVAGVPPWILSNARWPIAVPSLTLTISQKPPPSSPTN